MCVCSAAGLALTLSLCFQWPWTVYVMCVCVCVCLCVGGDMCVHVCERGVTLCIHVATPVCSCTYVALYVPRSLPPRDLVAFVKSGRQRVDNRGWCHIVFMSS